jgi:ectoine hydroxylase-related dioxygenase (phytanoyl-CoA dioxygenase family)
MSDAAATTAALPRFAQPYDWDAIDAATREVGGAILEGVLGEDLLNRLNAEMDAYYAAHPDFGRPNTGSETYDKFHGLRTIRMHGLTEKLASGAELIELDPIVRWAERLMHAVSDAIRLSAGESIDIGPGEPDQYLHRDSDSWPVVPLMDAPVVVNAIYALDDFTLENGATNILAGSWRWDKERRAQKDEIVRAVMKAGDALCFRGDLLHGGAANDSDANRRAISISYCAGWLRPVEESLLNVPPHLAKRHSRRIQALLGYTSHDATRFNGGVVGLYDNQDPRKAIEEAD